MIAAGLSALPAAEGKPPVEWAKSYGNEEEDWGQSLVQTDSGSYAIVGSTRSTGEGMTDLWLIVTDSQGTPKMAKVVGGTSSDNPQEVIQTENGDFVVAGSTRSYGLD